MRCPTYLVCLLLLVAGPFLSFPFPFPLFLSFPFLFVSSFFFFHVSSSFRLRWFLAAHWLNLRSNPVSSCGLCSSWTTLKVVHFIITWLGLLCI